MPAELPLEWDAMSAKEQTIWYLASFIARIEGMTAELVAATARLDSAASSSTKPSALVVPSTDLTIDATTVSSSTAKAPEVLELVHDPSPVCITVVPVTCSTECSTQVETIDSIDEVHDAATAVHLEPTVDPIHQAVEQLAPVQATASIGTNAPSSAEVVSPMTTTTHILPMADASLMPLVTRPAESVLSVAILNLSLLPAVVHQSDALAHVRCSTDYNVDGNDRVHSNAHTAHTPGLPPIQVQTVQVGWSHGSPHEGFASYFSSEWWPPDHQPGMKNKFPWMFRKYPLLNTQVHDKGLTSSYFSVNWFRLGDPVSNTWGRWLSLLGHGMRILPGQFMVVLLMTNARILPGQQSFWNLRSSILLQGIPHGSVAADSSYTWWPPDHRPGMRNNMQQLLHHTPLQVFLVSSVEQQPWPSGQLASLVYIEASNCCEAGTERTKFNTPSIFAICSEQFQWKVAWSLSSERKTTTSKPCLRHNLQFLLPPDNSPAVQVWSELQIVQFIEHQFTIPAHISEFASAFCPEKLWNTSEWSVLVHAAVGGIPINKKMMGIIQIMNISVLWQIWCHGEFKGSRHFGKECKSEQIVGGSRIGVQFPVRVTLNCCSPFGAAMLGGNTHDLLMAMEIFKELFEKLWPSGTQEEKFHHRQSTPLSSVVRRHWNPGDEQRYSVDISGYYGKLLVFLVCLVVQPICGCELILMEDPLSYLESAQQQFLGPRDRVTDMADHAKKGSELIHAEQVNYKVVQSNSCYMVQQLEGIGMATNFRMMKLQMPNIEASETCEYEYLLSTEVYHELWDCFEVGSSTTYLKSDEVCASVVSIEWGTFQNWELGPYLNQLLPLAYLRMVNSSPASLYIGAIYVDDLVQQWVTCTYASIQIGDAQYKCFLFPLCSAICIWEFDLGTYQMGMSWDPGGPAVFLLLELTRRAQPWEEFLAAGATMPLSAAALMCKSRLQQPTRCLPCRSIMVIGIYVTHNFYMISAGVQVALQEGRDVRDGTGFLDQVRHGSDFYFNLDHFSELVQVHLDCGYYHGDPCLIKDLQAPWDPGKLFMTVAWGQAAFQEGRDVRSPPIIIYMGWPLGPANRPGPFGNCRDDKNVTPSCVSYLVCLDAGI